MRTALALTGGAVMALCVTGDGFAADYTMRLSHQLPPTHHVAKAIDQFAAEVSANTGGKVEVQVFGAEQLFKASQNHAAVARGQVEAASIVSMSWGSTVPDMQVLSIPFLLTRAAQFKSFPASDAAKLLNAKMEEKGVKNIAWLVDANDGIFTSAKAPLLRPEDFKGVKIRGISKLYDNAFIAMGAAPSSMPGSEIYQALQTGVIDAGLTGVSAAYARRFYEVQKFGVALPLMGVYQNVVVNPAWWDKLPQVARQGIQDAARKAEAVLLPTTDDIDPEQVKRLRDTGMTVVLPTAQETKALEAAMQPPVIKAFSGASPDADRLVELIKKF